MHNVPIDINKVDQAGSGEKAAVFPNRNILVFVLITVLFFLWGMSNNLTDILVQQFKKSFELSPFQAQLVQTANFFGYFCMAIPAAVFMRKLGYKAGIISGLVLSGSGMLMFWPAALAGKYSLFLLAIFMVGCGVATLETAANPFIAQFGPATTSERRLNFSQAFNPPGTITGVLIGNFFIFSGIELSKIQISQMRNAGTYASYLHSELLRVVPTYVALGSIVLLMALLIALSKFPVFASERLEGEDHGNFIQLLRYRHLWLAVLAQFCYCGAQVSTWSAFIPYVRQYTSSTDRTAALYLTFSLGAMAVGRFISTGLMRWFAPTKMIGIYALINMSLLLVGVFRPGVLGMWAILVTSFFMSIMFPTIFALGIKGLGKNTKIGGSVIIMSIIGAAIVPPALGYIAKQTGSYALGYSVVLLAYLVVAWYGFWGSRTQGEPVTES